MCPLAPLRAQPPANAGSKASLKSRVTPAAAQNPSSPPSLALGWVCPRRWGECGGGIKTWGTRAPAAPFLRTLLMRHGPAAWRWGRPSLSDKGAVCLHPRCPGSESLGRCQALRIPRLPPPSSMKCLGVDGSGGGWAALVSLWEPGWLPTGDKHGGGARAGPASPFGLARLSVGS